MKKKQSIFRFYLMTKKTQNKQTLSSIVIEIMCMEMLTMCLKVRLSLLRLLYCVIF